MKLRRTLRLVVLVMPVALAGLAVGCSTNPVTGKKQLILISTEQEVALGADAAPQFEGEFGGLVPDGELQAYVRDIGSRLADHSDRKDVRYEFALLASDVPNAFALPGGKVYVTAGLMVLMTNERQLAGVLGHEITHVAAKHNVMGMQRQMGAAVLVELAGYAAGGDKAKAAEAATQIASGMVNLKYGRDDEYQADQYGCKYMAKAGYNPWGVVEMLEVLKGLHDSEPGSLGELFQTHPITSKRIERARGVVRSEYPQYSPESPDPKAGRFIKMRDKLPPYIKKHG